MFRTSIAAAALALTLCLVPSLATAATDAGTEACEDATRFIRDAGAEGVAALKSGSESRFRSVFTRFADTHAMARFALGRHVRRLRGAKRERYYRLATDHLVKTLVGNLSDLGIRRLAVNGCRRQTGSVVIASDLVLKSGKRYPVKWRLRAGDGFKVVDMNIFDVWLTFHYRSEFSTIIAQGGNVDALLRHLSGGGFVTAAR